MISKLRLNNDHVGKRLDKKAKVNFEIYDVTNWEANDYNTPHIKPIEKTKRGRELVSLPHFLHNF